MLNDEQVRDIESPESMFESMFGNADIKHCNKIHIWPRVDILGIPDATFAMFVDSKGQKQVAERLLKSTGNVTTLH